MLIKYRPEIDGLRAIAVGAVILYHAKLNIFGQEFFKGGFLGVDIFFVISGYLITSIILKEIFNTGTFSLKSFYERRVRRILPPLLFVMLISMPFAAYYLLPTNSVDFSKSIISSLGFISNFYFYFSGQEYGAFDGLFKPFLHTWSLSVEEQFYIIFPIFLFIIFRYFKKLIGLILLTTFLISLLAANFYSITNPALNFYLLPSRAWELMAGSILAYYETQFGYRCKNKLLNLVLPGIGLFLIGFSIIFFKNEIFHPSFYTLLPVIGVCLILWFSNKEEAITKLLSSKLFVSFGLISYSLYLFHYPLFSFIRIADIIHWNSIYGRIYVGLSLLILSIISYYFIEKPSRNKKNKFKFIFFLIITSILILIIFNLINISKKGYNDKYPEILLKNNPNLKNWLSLKNAKGESCWSNPNGCIFNPNSNKKVIITGDSLMGSLMDDLKSKVTDKNYSFRTDVIGCLYFPDFDRYDKVTNQKNLNCTKEYFDLFNLNLEKNDKNIIIIGGRYPLHLNNRFFDNKEGGTEKGGTEYHQKYVQNGKYKSINEAFVNHINIISKNSKIILVYPLPEFGWHVYRKYLNFYKKNKNDNNLLLNNVISTSFKIYKERTRSTFNLFDS